MPGAPSRRPAAGYPGGSWSSSPISLFPVQGWRGAPAPASTRILEIFGRRLVAGGVAVDRDPDPPRRLLRVRLGLALLVNRQVDGTVVVARLGRLLAVGERSLGRAR